MGNKVSKSRKFADTVAKEGVSIKRTSDVNQIPSNTLRENYNKHVSEQQATGGNGTNPPFQGVSNASFDPAYLKKKLRNAPNSQGNVSVPEGKDGQDPQGTFGDDYLRVITNMGKQINTEEGSTKSVDHSWAVEQLKVRKDLYEKGQREIDLQRNPALFDNSKSAGPSRTMVDPSTLVSILNDLVDPRITKERIVEDYQLHPDFLKELGTRFKVASNYMPVEEKPKEDEVGPQGSAVGSSGQEMDSDMPDAGNLQKLQKRISVDD